MNKRAILEFSNEEGDLQKNRLRLPSLLLFHQALLTLLCGVSSKRKLLADPNAQAT